jgi:hypothetical protein
LRTDTHTGVSSGFRIGNNHWRPGLDCRVVGLISESYSPLGQQLLFVTCV